MDAVLVCRPENAVMNATAQRVWVVGAGFLGSELLRLCRRRGASTLSIDKCAPADIAGEAQDMSVLQRAVARMDPQVIFICTSTRGGDSESYRATYAKVTERVVRAASGARVVLCSTCSVYEEYEGREVTETSACPGTTEKMRAVMQAEASALAASGVVARLAALYGSGRCEIVRRFVQEGVELPGGRERWVNYVHVSDAAKALMLLATSGTAGQVYNVCGETLQLRHLYAQLEAERLRRGAPPTFEPLSGRNRANMRVCASKIRTLGWKAKESLQDFAQRMIAEGKLGEKHNNA